MFSGLNFGQTQTYTVVSYGPPTNPKQYNCVLRYNTQPDTSIDCITTPGLGLNLQFTVCVGLGSAAQVCLSLCLSLSRALSLFLSLCLFVLSLCLCVCLSVSQSCCLCSATRVQIPTPTPSRPPFTTSLAAPTSLHAQSIAQQTHSTQTAIKLG